MGTVIVIIIFLAAAYYLYRYFSRSFKGERLSCGCGADDCAACDYHPSDSQESDEMPQPPSSK